MPPTTKMIGFVNLLREVAEHFDLPELVPTIAARVFEDNNGALTLATNQRLTSRTRYLLARWHHFWSHVGSESHQIRIFKVDTNSQGADYLTKSLVRDKFENNRRLLQGW